MTQWLNHTMARFPLAQWLNVLMIQFLLVIAGCDASADSTKGILIVGGPGGGDGRFATPRRAAWDPGGHLFVVDKTGRIQRFDGQGRFEHVWRTPSIEKGRPTGLAVAPDQTLLVADTHYFRILRYDFDGTLLDEFGGQGREPGKFLYPVGLAVAPDGTIYVSEFGGNDRIQVFSAKGEFLRGWGRYGKKPGEFRRPQGLALDGDLLYVADAVNHRVQVLKTDGTPVAQWTGLKFPYSVSVDVNGEILVAEYGNHCVSRFRSDGTLVSRAGTPGPNPGELDTPWDAVSSVNGIYVVDSRNHRVQLWKAERWRSP